MTDRSGIQSGSWLAFAAIALMVGQLCFVGTPVTWWRLGLGVALHGCGLVAAVWAARAGDLDLQPVRTTRRGHWLAALALLALAVVLHFAWLGSVPQRIDGDAAAFALGGTAFLGPQPPPIIGTGWQAHSNLYFWIVSLATRMFGRTALAVRWWSAVGGTLGVLAVYWLGTTWWNLRVGVLAALVLALLPFHLVFARVGTEVVQLTWLLPVALTLCSTGTRRRSPWRLLLAGAVVGFSQYFYPGARLIPILALAAIGLLVWWPPDGADRDWRWGVRATAWVTFGFLLVYAPMIAHYAGDPDAYLARIRTVSITSGRLQEQLATAPAWLVLIEQARRALLPFHYPVGRALFWYQWPQYLQPIDAALLTLGLVLIALSRATPRWLRWFGALYLGLAIFLGGFMTTDTPMPSRYVVLLPAVALAIGYAQAVLVQRVLRRDRPWRFAIVAALLLAYGGLNLRTYLLHDNDALWRSDPTNQLATLAAAQLATYPDQRFNIVFLSTASVYFDASPTLPYITGKSGVDLEDPIDCATLAPHLSANGTVIIAPDDRRNELAALAPQLTPATFAALMNPQNATLGAVLYVAPSTVAPRCHEASAQSR